LTMREVEVLRLVARGRSNQQIADDLSMSARTAERHISNIYGKIDAHSRAEATAYAFERRLA
jgi:DNA-binding NarL/FixJ family response regulator